MLNFIMFFTKLLQILYIIERVCQGFLLEFALETRLISVQRNDGVFLLETDWLFEGHQHALARGEWNYN